MALDQDQKRNALTVLTRLCQRFPDHLGRLVELIGSDVDAFAPLALDVAVETGEPMGAALRTALTTRAPSNDVLRTMLDRITPDSSLGPLALGLAAQLAARPHPDAASAVDALVRNAFWLQVNGDPIAAGEVVARAKQIANNAEPRLTYTLLLRLIEVEARACLDMYDHDRAAMTISDGLRIAEARLPRLTEPWKGVLHELLAVTLAKTGRRAEARTAALEAKRTWQALLYAPDPSVDVVVGLPKVISAAGPEQMEALYTEQGFGSRQLGSLYMVPVTTTSDQEFLTSPRWMPSTELRKHAADTACLLARLDLTENDPESARNHLADSPEAPRQLSFLRAVAHAMAGDSTQADSLLSEALEGNPNLQELISDTVELSYTPPTPPGRVPLVTALAGLAARRADDGEMAAEIVSLFDVHLDVAPDDSTDLQAHLHALIRTATAQPERARLASCYFTASGDPTSWTSLPPDVLDAFTSALAGPLPRTDCVEFLRAARRVTVHLIVTRQRREGWSRTLAELAGQHDDDTVRAAFVDLCWPLGALAMDNGDFGTVRAVIADLVALVERHPDDTEALVVHGRCATDLMGILWNSGATAEAIDVARRAEHLLRSPVFLAARQAEIGEAPEDFLNTLDAILGAE